MELAKKLEILSGAAKYDVSCSSSGSKRKNTPGGLGNAAASGICHSWSDDGRCISLLKILFSNNCIFDCKYCVNRSSNDIPRASFTPHEVANITINFYRRNYIEGLFLSSGVLKNADYTMELLLKTVNILRKDYKFNGYIHLKAIPGASMNLITECGKLVDRMSVNIELPSNQGLKLLAPQKNQQTILKPMEYISTKITESKEDKRFFKHAMPFVPAGQSTQLIVGATPDHDIKILKLSENLYKSYQLKRVYYSAYVPVTTHPSLPSITNPPLLREHRLYQADWLLRFYGFSANELLDENNPDFDEELDPKAYWALRNLHVFPVEINKAHCDTLLRVPGIGVGSAKKIILARKIGPLNFDHLKKMGVVLKRAQFFITCQGKTMNKMVFHDGFLRQALLSGHRSLETQPHFEQISLFPPPSPPLPLLDALSSITGEL